MSGVQALKAQYKGLSNSSFHPRTLGRWSPFISSFHSSCRFAWVLLVGVVKCKDPMQDMGHAQWLSNYM